MYARGRQALGVGDPSPDPAVELHRRVGDVPVDGEKEPAALQLGVQRERFVQDNRGVVVPIAVGCHAHQVPSAGEVLGIGNAALHDAIHADHRVGRVRGHGEGNAGHTLQGDVEGHGAIDGDGGGIIGVAGRAYLDVVVSACHKRDSAGDIGAVDIDHRIGRIDPDGEREAPRLHLHGEGHVPADHDGADEIIVAGSLYPDVVRAAGHRGGVAVEGDIIDQIWAPGTLTAMVRFQISWARTPGGRETP